MTMIPWDQIIKNSAGSFDPVPTADYDMFVESAEPAQASTGNPMIRTKLRITGGPHDGRRIWNNFVIALDNPNSLSFFFQHMAIFGMDSSYITALPPLNPEMGADDPSLRQIAANMAGRPLRARVGQQSYNGQPRNNIERVMPPATPGLAAAPSGFPSSPYPQAPAPQYPQAPTPQPYQQPDPWAQQQPAAPQYPYPQAPAPQYSQQPQQQPQYPQPQYRQPTPGYTQPGYPAAPSYPQPQQPQQPPYAQPQQAPMPPQYPQPPQAPPQDPAAAQAYPQPPQQGPAF